MKHLSTDWITEGLMDAEYKSYILLDYLSAVKEEFNAQKLYPVFADLVQHYQNLLAIKTGREEMKNAFPKTIERADWENFRFELKEKAAENEFFEEMDQIISYAIPAMQHYLEDGKSLYHFVEKQLNISPVGLSSLSQAEGFFFLLAPPKRTTKIYCYHSTQMHMPDGQYRALHVRYVDEVSLSYSKTLENIKLELVRLHPKPEVPATFLIESDVWVPWEESLLPVAKRRLVEYLGKD